MQRSEDGTSTIDSSFFQVRRNHPRDSLSMLLLNQISRMLLQKVQSVKLGLFKPCCPLCNYVICLICENDSLSSVSYSEHHNHVYPCTLPNELPDAVISETRLWVEALLRNHLTSTIFQDKLDMHLNSHHSATSSITSRETNLTISPDLSEENSIVTLSTWRQRRRR